MPVKVITWASPRGGNDVYKDHVNSLPNLNFWRFVYQQDPVPRLPLSDEGVPIIGGFYHAGHLIDISETNAKAYYFQTGGDGYAGVPDSWDCKLLIFHRSKQRVIAMLSFFQMKLFLTLLKICFIFLQTTLTTALTLRMITSFQTTATTFKMMSIRLASGQAILKCKSL